MLKNKVIQIIENIFNTSNYNFNEHSTRVGYIVYEMCIEENMGHKKAAKMALTAILHDIGCFQNDDFDKQNDNHAIIGSQVLRYCNILNPYSLAIRYHHYLYSKLVLINLPKRIIDLADKIHLADTIEHQITQQVEINLDFFSEEAFGKDNVNTLKKVIAKCLNNIKTNEDKRILNNLFDFNNFKVIPVKNFLMFLISLNDFRSPATLTHSYVTVIYSIEIAKLLRLSRYKIKRIALGAGLHDIGKIATPVSILEKKDRLTDEEYRIIKEHVVITREILSGNISEDILEIACRHHEKLDGSGYPSGLKSEELTTSQRIVCVADILSALLGERSYKKSFSKDDCLRILSDAAENDKIDADIFNIVVLNYDYLYQRVRRKIMLLEKNYKGYMKDINLMKKSFNA